LNFQNGYRTKTKEQNRVSTTNKNTKRLWISKMGIERKTKQQNRVSTTNKNAKRLWIWLDF
jgi:hypothetical protein